MIFIVSTCGDIPKEELIELQKRLEAEANSPNKNKVMCLPRFATIASIDDYNSIKTKVTMNKGNNEHRCQNDIYRIQT